MKLVNRELDFKHRKSGPRAPHCSLHGLSRAHRQPGWVATENYSTRREHRVLTVLLFLLANKKEGKDLVSVLYPCGLIRLESE